MRALHQSGMSLIELMVGLAIGLVVVIAAMGSVVYTRTASSVMGESTRLQQDAATAFRIIGHATRQAGARRLVDIEEGAVSFNPQYEGISVDQNTWRPITLTGADGASNKPDTLNIDRDNTVPAQGAASPANIDSVDCLGETVPAQFSARSTFSVDEAMLKCEGSGSSVGRHALVPGAEDFQIWYGLREGNGLRYTTASALSQLFPAPWNQVETLRVCLRLAGEQTNLPSAPIKGCQGETIQNDGRLRRVFFRVFKLRNAGR
jgi:type IV pilus assembly protein PilW